MGFLNRLLATDGPATPGPAADFWYRDLGAGGVSQAGPWVDGETAQKISAWYRGRDILATVLAMLPFPLYEKLPNDGGSEPATGHPLYDVLHNNPNSWQDSFQWRRQKMYHLIDHGNGYDWIIEGPRGFADQLQPIHPTLVTPEQIKRGPSKGRILYHVRDEQTQQTTVHTQDEIFHLRGASEDGVSGKGILAYARTSIGTALATESYAAKIFSKGMLSGGHIEVPGPMDPEAAKRMAKSFVTASGDWHMPKVLEMGAKLVANGMTPTDAQMLLSRKYGVDDVARWLGVPRQMLENSDPSFGNAEQFDQNFITYSMGGWLSLFEFAVNSQLLLIPKKYYAEFTRDAIARGKLTDRWNVHVAAVNAGLKTPDECRVKEGLNRRGGTADELRVPQNITGKPIPTDDTDDPPAPPPGKKKRIPPPADDEDDDDSDDKAHAIVVESAARLLRKEVTAIEKQAVKLAGDQDGWATWLTAFYDKHAELVAQTLQLDEETARTYCAGQAAQLLEPGGLRALENWQTRTYARSLASLALQEAA